MTQAGEDTLRTYREDSVVDLYDQTRDLQWPEKQLFDEYLKPGMRVLDLGVGAGRTTRYLAEGAKEYIGLDYSDKMVERCRERFPGLKFVCQDASDLSQFETESFDLVVFSFNGLGTLPTDAFRRRCVNEVARVLKRNSMFIFSLHNARFIVYPPVFAGAGANPAKALWRLTYAAMQTGKNAVRRLPKASFWTGQGYVVDPGQHSELSVFTCSPERVKFEVERASFSVERVLSTRPRELTTLLTPHYYYACQRR